MAYTKEELIKIIGQEATDKLFAQKEEIEKKEEDVQSEDNDLSEDSKDLAMADLDDLKKRIGLDDLTSTVEELAEKLNAPDRSKVPDGVDGVEPDKLWDSNGAFLKAVADKTLLSKLDERLTWQKDVFANKEERDGAVAVQKQTTGHLEEGVGSFGGFLVPVEFRDQLLMLALEQSVVRPRAFVIPMNTDALEIPTVDDTSHASNVFGGVTGTWIGEAASLSLSNPTFGSVTLNPKKLTLYTFASNELLADNAIGLEQLLMQMFSSALSYFEDTAFLAGTGSGQPLGVENSPCLISTTRTTASKVEYLDLTNMIGRMLPTSFARAVWIMSPAVLPEILDLESPAATAATAGGHLAYMPANQGAKSSIFPMTLFGRPVFVTEKIPTLGTAGDIKLCDFSQYLIGDRQSMVIEASIHNRFANDQLTWRAKLRTDGQPWMSAALTPKNSGDTLSPFVQLGST